MSYQEWAQTPIWVTATRLKKYMHSPFEPLQW
jgi:hypothetical protein